MPGIRRSTASYAHWATSAARRVHSGSSWNFSVPTSSGLCRCRAIRKFAWRWLHRVRLRAGLRKVGRIAIHVATEGPLGHAMRRVCLRGGLPFTTSFHTRFSDYLAERLPVPERWTSEVMGLVAPVSCIGRRDACRNADACFRAHHARLQKRRAVATRCRCRTLPAARAGQFEFSSPDFSDGRPACGGKKP